MFTKKAGFTIVELLITIVVIGILAAITTVAFNGVQTRALNASKSSELNSWHKLFQVYKATYGNYPLPDSPGNYCLGNGFPSGKCRDYQSPNYFYLESNNAALLNELKKVGGLPNGPRVPINGTIGPYVNLWATGYTITTVLKGSSGDCPAPLVYEWDDGNGRLLCKLDNFN